MDKESHTSIYLLPNLFTTVSLFAAFYSIVSSMKGNFEHAVIGIFIGMIADGLDGRIARLTNTSSVFGAEYDSLSDMVTFGVAPSLLAYGSTLQSLGKMGWLIAFVYTAATALRLARFNAQHDVADKRFFQGLPCPPAAVVLSSFIWFFQEYQLPNNLFVTVATAAITFSLSLLMVSNIRYYSFKEVDFKGKVPFLYILLMVIIFVMVAVNPAVILLCGFSLYALSGPIVTLYNFNKLRREKT